jgi:hypothetical protein
MKNLKKVLAVMTAVTAMAASTSAFAANIAEVKGGVTGTYAEGKLSVTTPAAADTTKGDMTLLVLTEGALADEAVADGEILYIDQGTAGFAGLGLKTDVLGAVTAADGHIIKVGYYDADGNFAIAQGYIKVSEDKPAVEYINLQLGDCADLNGTVDVSDVTAAVKHILGSPKLTGNYLIVGNADQDSNGAIDVSDVTAIVKHILGSPKLGTIQVEK